MDSEHCVIPGTGSKADAEEYERSPKRKFASVLFAHRGQVVLVASDQSMI